MTVHGINLMRRQMPWSVPEIFGRWLVCMNAVCVGWNVHSSSRIRRHVIESPPVRFFTEVFVEPVGLAGLREDEHAGAEQGGQFGLVVLVLRHHEDPLRRGDGVAAEDVLDRLEELRLAVGAAAVVDEEVLERVAADCRAAGPLEERADLGIRLPPFEAGAPQRGRGRRVVDHGGLDGEEIFGVVGAQVAGAQVDRAVEHVQDPRHLVEVGVVDKDAGGASGEVDHRADRAGRLRRAGPSEMDVSDLLVEVGGVLEHLAGDGPGPLADDRLSEVDDPAAVVVDEPLTPQVDVTEMAVGVGHETVGVADVGRSMPVEESEGESAGSGASSWPPTRRRTSNARSG